MTRTGKSHSTAAKGRAVRHGRPSGKGRALAWFLEFKASDLKELQLQASQALFSLFPHESVIPACPTFSFLPKRGVPAIAAKYFLSLIDHEWAT